MIAPTMRLLLAALTLDTVTWILRPRHSRPVEWLLDRVFGSGDA